METIALRREDASLFKTAGRLAACPSVAVIVLTWNQRDLTLDCLKSLAKLDYPANRLEIIVVDNGSVDGTANAIRNSASWVTVLENDENLGFAEGNNTGIRHVMQGQADYVMLLNNDTVVAHDMLRRLLVVAEAEPCIGIVTPKIYYFDQPTRIWCAGADVDLATGRTRRLRAEEDDNEETEMPHNVGFASGCGICLKRSVIEDIGLLDSRFFLYYEETDWCLRAIRAGWRVVYVPEAKMWHKVSATMGTNSPATEYYMNRNVLLFLRKNQRGLARVGSLMAAAGLNLRTVAAYTVKPRKSRRSALRNARLLALRDAVLGRWGKMGPDVTAKCYPCASE